MRVSKAQAAQNRETILSVASRQFREHGIDGIGIADLAKSAGLTHGCLYSHFESKDALVAEACAETLARSAEKWAALVEAAPEDPLGAIVAHYLSAAHRDGAGEGCLVAALAADIARQEPATRHALTEGLRPLVAILAGCSGTGSAAGDRRLALARMSSLVGAIVLARAVDDPKLSGEILKGTAAALAASE